MEEVAFQVPTKTSHISHQYTKQYKFYTTGSGLDKKKK
jgi:hypothetical protein